MANDFMTRIKKIKMVSNLLPSKNLVGGYCGVDAKTRQDLPRIYITLLMIGHLQ